MKYKYRIKTLTQEQYDLLNRVARRTRNDCWFDIRQKKDGTDYVYDLEEGRRWCLRTGIRTLMEALDCEENYYNCALSCMESFRLWDLCRYLEIETPPYMNPIIRRGISAENLIALLEEDHIDYTVPGDDDAIHCQDYVFQFDRDGVLFDIVNLFYVGVR